MFSRTDMSGTMPSTFRSSEQKPTPSAIASTGSAGAAALPIEPNRAGVGRIGAENRARHFGPARSQQAGQSDDLPGAHLEARVPDLPADDEPFRGEHLAASRRRSPLEAGGALAHRLDVAPEHRRDEAQLVDLGHPTRHHGAAVAHHRHPVANLIEFVQPVGDEDHRHALGAQLPDDVEQHRDLALVERRRRLVHDHQPRLERHGARDRHHLLDRGAEFHQRTAHVDLDGETAQQIRRRRGSCGANRAGRSGEIRGRGKCSRRPSGRG